jgi:hypothetical protein
VISVSPDKPVKLDFDRTPDKTVRYSGDEITVKL